ncbi:DUF1993 domain-containing protein [Neogemmobacter tilapiae]|uniref:DUF1993 domain-containing protein n=1 Tax=Neogemmobacter tilapiae TaxID=875041 RepID=A0A918TEY6_9RHOB|nr:DUF1993 domain-containing protein [Gemmobacter tilapiae]GHC45721.1 hypothetical protein GCM10007315_04030 [Gemmobacter tilapiae]
MTVSFFDLGVPTFLQTVRSVGVCLDKATVHCRETGTDPDELVSARLFPDMAPFFFQIECIDNYSVWGLDAIRGSVFNPPDLVGPVPFRALQARISGTEAALTNLTPEEVNAWSGKKLDMQIHTDPQKTAFVAETYLLSFLLPNFYFHAVTAYDILRAQGVPIGKRDFEGQLRSNIR